MMFVIICTGIGTPASLKIQTYLNVAQPTVFFGTIYSLYSSIQPNPDNVTLLFSYSLFITGFFSFFSLLWMDTYKTRIGSQCLVIVPLSISSITLLYWLRNQYVKIFETFKLPITEI